METRLSFLSLSVAGSSSIPIMLHDKHTPYARRDEWWPGKDRTQIRVVRFEQHKNACNIERDGIWNALLITRKLIRKTADVIPKQQRCWHQQRQRELTLGKPFYECAVWGYQHHMGCVVLLCDGNKKSQQGLQLLWVCVSPAHQSIGLVNDECWPLISLLLLSISLLQHLLTTVTKAPIEEFEHTWQGTGATFGWQCHCHVARRECLQLGSQVSANKLQLAGQSFSHSCEEGEGNGGKHVCQAACFFQQSLR